MMSKHTKMTLLNELRDDCASKQKRGIHFIIASVMIWAGIAAVHLSPMNLLAKNLFTFCLSAPPSTHCLSRV